MNFSISFYIFKNTVFETRKRIQGYDREIVRSTTQKSLEFNMKSCYKNVSKIRNVTFIFQKRKKIIEFSWILQN